MHENSRFNCLSLTNVLLTLVLTLVVAFVWVDLSAAAAPFQEAPPTEQEQQKERQEREKAKDYKKDSADKNESTEKADSDKPKASDDKKADKQSDEAKPESGKSKDGEKQEEAATARDSGDSSRGDSRRRRSRSSGRTSNSFLDVFRPVIGDAAKATVEVRKGDDTIALGAIVDANGYVLTKHSELQSPLTCKLFDGRDVPAYVYGVHPATDLALLKVEAENLPIVPWVSEDSLDIGHWLATIKDNERPLGVGVVGVNARLIKPESGFMGVNLRQTERGVEITNVTAKSPAEKGGLKRSDIITKVNGESFTEIDKLIPRVKSFPPGEEIRLTLLRSDREIIADVVLGEERSLNPLYERSNQQNTMGGNKLSRRRQNFPLAVQHDTFLKPQQCGGPVVNIEGKVVGINIARQGRVSSLMLPTALVRNVINDLKTGQWAPAVVHKSRIDEISRTLLELNTQVALSPMNNDDLKKKVNKLTNDEKKLRAKLDKMSKERMRAELEMERASETFDTANAEIKRLEREREKLVTGTK